MKVVDMIDGMLTSTHVAHKIINKKSNCYKKVISASNKNHITPENKYIKQKNKCIPQF